ncbi:MAG: hypothetical protein QNJ98_01845 [Planctomycetota bacterium]|nr:hypothetical protein [Planctomycetota bacterium]
MMHRLLALALPLCLLLAPAAFAADDGETLDQAKDTIKAIEKARKEKDVTALGPALVRAVELHNGLEGDSIRKKLQAAIGSLLKSKRAAALHAEALSALEQLDDGDGVFKQLKPVLPGNGDAKVGANGLHAIQIVGAVGSPKGVKYLTALAFNGKSMAAREEAVRSLSRYREVKAARVSALTSLLELLIKLKPQEGKSMADAQRKAWGALEQPIVKALDDLTFLELQKSSAWVEWHGANKDKLKRVFTD